MWRRNLLAVTGTSFIGFSGFTLVMPFLPLFVRQLGVSDVSEIALWTGATLGVTPALSALVSPFWGRLADRYGRKIMLVRALISCAIFMVLMSLVTEAWHLFALRASLGLVTGYGGLSLTMAADSAPRDQMALAIGRVQTAQRLGPALGPVMGGFVAGWLGLRPACLVAAGFYLVALVLVITMYDERYARGSRVDSNSPQADRRVSFRTLVSRQNFALLMTLVFATQFVDRSIGPILALFVEQIGVSGESVAASAGMFFSVIALSAAFGHHRCNHLLQRYSSAVVISGAATVSAVGVALLASAVTPWMVLPAVAMLGAGNGTALTALYTTAGGIIPHGAEATGFSLLTSSSLVGVASSPILAGLLGGVSFRLVFVLDVLILAAIAFTVRRKMIVAEAVP